MTKIKEMDEYLEREVKGKGNSAGISLPRKYIGKIVNIIIWKDKEEDKK